MVDNLRLLQSPRLRSETGTPNPEPSHIVLAPTFSWPTPGAFVSTSLAGRPEVRLVVERFDGDRYGVVILLRSDPEEVLDLIYTLESQLFDRALDHPFALRATCPGGDLEEHARRLQSDHFVHYDSQWFK